MKKLSIFATAAFLTLTAASLASAASTTVNVSLTYQSTVAIADTQDLSFKLAKVSAKSGTYSASDVGFNSTWPAGKITPGVVTVTADASTAVAITYPATIALTGPAAATGTMGVAGYGSATSAPVSPTGAYTSGASATTNSSGNYYVALSPSTMVFTGDTVGAWTGSATVGADYY